MRAVYPEETESMATSDGTLRRHVIESNKIEGIVADESNPLYDSHFAAAQLAAKGDVIHPNELHKVLAQDVHILCGYAGRYRSTGVWVAERKMPLPDYVPALMDAWWRMVQEYLVLSAGRHVLEDAADFIHARLLCIHPYADGNGRTARLVCNMLRVYHGLPWHIEYAEGRETYYAGIRFAEDAFKREYPNIY